MKDFYNVIHKHKLSLESFELKFISDNVTYVFLGNKRSDVMDLYDICFCSNTSEKQLWFEKVRGDLMDDYLDMFIDSHSLNKTDYKKIK